MEVDLVPVEESTNWNGTTVPPSLAPDPLGERESTGHREAPAVQPADEPSDAPERSGPQRVVAPKRDRPQRGVAPATEEVPSPPRSVSPAPMVIEREAESTAGNRGVQAASTAPASLDRRARWILIAATAAILVIAVAGILLATRKSGASKSSTARANPPTPGRVAPAVVPTVPTAAGTRTSLPGRAPTVAPKSARTWSFPSVHRPDDQTVLLLSNPQKQSVRVVVRVAAGKVLARPHIPGGASAEVDLFPPYAARPLEVSANRPVVIQRSIIHGSSVTSDDGQPGS